MDTKFRIAVLGIGGVGGYVGGKLARRHSGSGLAEINFIARNENAKAIKSNGLKLIMPEGEIIIHPDSVTENPAELGLLDLIICCVKSYSLEKAIAQLKKCVNKETAILPLLNGVNASERIQKILPEAETWSGCIHIISHIYAPGIIKVGELLPEIYFGATYGSPAKLTSAADLLAMSGLNAVLSENIVQKVWEKFVFLSPIATLTSYLNLNMGEIVGNLNHKKLLKGLINEVVAVAEAKQIDFGENIIQETIQKCENLPPESTTSMHKDFQRGNETEIDSLTSYVIKEGKKLGIETPIYKRLFTVLKSKKL